MAQQAPIMRLPRSRHHLAKKAAMTSTPAIKLEASLPTPPLSPKRWAPVAPAHLQTVSEKGAAPKTPQSNDECSSLCCRIIPSAPAKRLLYSCSHLAKRAEIVASPTIKLEVFVPRPSPAPGLWAPGPLTNNGLWSAAPSSTDAPKRRTRAGTPGTPTFSGSCDFHTPNYNIATHFPPSPPLSPCSLPSAIATTSARESSISIATPSSDKVPSKDDIYRLWPANAHFPAPNFGYDSPSWDRDGDFTRAVDAKDLKKCLKMLPLKELGKWRVEGESIVRAEKRCWGGFPRRKESKGKGVVVSVEKVGESL